MPGPGRGRNANADARVKTIAGVRPHRRAFGRRRHAHRARYAGGRYLAGQPILDDIKGAAGAPEGRRHWRPEAMAWPGSDGRAAFRLLVIRSAMGVTTQLLADPAAGRIWQRAHNGTAWTVDGLAKDAAATNPHPAC